MSYLFFSPAQNFTPVGSKQKSAGGQQKTATVNCTHFSGMKPAKNVQLNFVGQESEQVQPYNIIYIYIQYISIVLDKSYAFYEWSFFWTDDFWETFQKMRKKLSVSPGMNPTTWD